MKTDCLVMLIEDSSDTRELCLLALRGNSFEVRGFPTAKDALAILESGVKPDLILCDIMMPGLDGDQLITILRRDSRWANIRVVIVSGVPDLKKRALEVGANGYLRKPFDLEQLEQVVQEHVRAVC